MKHKAPGILPNVRWLDANGWCGLVVAMHKHPEAFIHIRQLQKGGRTIDEWVSIARKLSKKNHGILPSPSNLISNGYGGLYQFFLKYPERFSGITIQKQTRNLGEWVTIAKRLSKEHNNSLPGIGWLNKNGYSGLAKQIAQHPEVFTKIRQQWAGGKSAQEWVLIARELVVAHGDLLPRPTWLNKNGFSGLVYSMRHYPQLFHNIPQAEKRYLTPSEWVTIAEKLAEQYQGTLPNVRWLRNNGHGGLDAAMTRYPNLFAHIKQKRLRK